MLFVLHALDKAGHGHVRKANMDAHVAYLRAKPITLVVAGPLLDPEGAAIGSMLVVDAESLAEVTRFTQGDPYTKAGLFGEVQIHSYRKTFGWEQPL